MKFPSPYTTSVDGKCFYKAINIACLVVGARFLVHLSLIKEFEDIQEAKGQKEDPERSVFDQWYEGGEGQEYYEESLANLMWIRRCNFIRRFERVGTGLEGEERHVQDECFLRSHMGKKLRARVWSYKDSGLDEEDGDEVELLELCVQRGDLRSA
ncbi:hypothetical protein PInf_019148 [Phytophthora infestans]|nr:hypothetical protein PInf_019148 [Phytophthora infestans]